MEFAKNLRELRRSKNLTQEQLAGLVNVSSQAVSKWETSDTLPDTALLPEIAKALDTSIDALFSYRSSDNMNLYQAVERHINQSDSLPEKVERLFSLLLSGEKACHNEDTLEPEYWWDDYSSQKYEPKFESAVAASQIITLYDDAVSWMFESRLFPYAAVFLKPKEGYTSIFRDNEAIENLFDAMGDSDVRKCLMYLLSGTRRSITLSALLERSGVPLSRMEEIAEKLTNIDRSSIRIRCERINDEQCTIVSYTDTKPGILMLLAAAYACSVSRYGSRSQRVQRDEPIL